MTRAAIASEADIIQSYFAPLAAGFAGAHGLRDDAASLAPPPGMDLVLTMDAIAAGVHFFPDDPPADIGWKALAVNVSDLAAKGAQPYAYLMSLAFPGPPSREWMAPFAAGLGEAQRTFGLSLIGGDTDHRPGPLSITITALGVVPHAKMVARCTPGVGDQVLVSGTLGDSALGLMLRADAAKWSLSDDHRACLNARYLRPQPRLALAPLLREYASAAMDISDGLWKDLSRMVEPKRIGARIYPARLPLSDAARAVVEQDPAALGAILTGGDDYEVLTTMPPESAAAFTAAAAAVGVAITDIGVIGGAHQVYFLDGQDQEIHLTLNRPGYDHF